MKVMMTIAAVSLAVTASAQTLADVAKKTQEISTKTPATKTYTNTDLTAQPEPTPPPTPAQPSRLVSTPSSSSARQSAGGRDENAWRTKALALRRKLDADLTALAAAVHH